MPLAPDGAQLDLLVRLWKGQRKFLLLLTIDGRFHIQCLPVARSMVRRTSSLRHTAFGRSPSLCLPMPLAPDGAQLDLLVRLWKGQRKFLLLLTIDGRFHIQCLPVARSMVRRTSSLRHTAFGRSPSLCLPMPLAPDGAQLDLLVRLWKGQRKFLLLLTIDGRFHIQCLPVARSMVRRTSSLRHTAFGRSPSLCLPMPLAPDGAQLDLLVRLWRGQRKFLLPLQ